LVIPVSKRAVDAVFAAMFALTDLRVLLRDTAPSHELGPEERGRAERHLKELEQQVTILRQELVR
jgi:hypothetical protein